MANVALDGLAQYSEAPCTARHVVLHGRRARQDLRPPVTGRIAWEPHQLIDQACQWRPRHHLDLADSSGLGTWERSSAYCIPRPDMDLLDDIVEPGSSDRSRRQRPGQPVVELGSPDSQDLSGGLDRQALAGRHGYRLESSFGGTRRSKQIIRWRRILFSCRSSASSLRAAWSPAASTDFRPGLRPVYVSCLPSP
jgi:hypothetical protein